MLIDQLSEKEIVALHNQLSKNPVKKFRDRKTGEQRLLNLAEGKSREQMLAAAMAAKLRPPLIQQWSYLKGPEVAFEVPPDLTVVQRKPKKEKKKKTNGKTTFLPSEAALIILSCLRRMIPEGSTGEAAQANSTDVARALGTSIEAVCKAAETLSQSNLVGIEDDSPSDDVKFLWISLTEEGREYNIEEAEELLKKKLKKKSRLPGEKTEKKVLPNPSPGPRSSKAGKVIFKVSKENPRKEGTWGWKSFNALKDGMTYEQYISAGGRPNDLAWDLQHGYVELRDAAPAVVAEKKK